MSSFAPLLHVISHLFLDAVIGFTIYFAAHEIIRAVWQASRIARHVGRAWQERELLNGHHDPGCRFLTLFICAFRSEFCCSRYDRHMLEGRFFNYIPWHSTNARRPLLRWVSAVTARLSGAAGGAARRLAALVAPSGRKLPSVPSPAPQQARSVDDIKRDAMARLDQLTEIGMPHRPSV